MPLHLDEGGLVIGLAAEMNKFLNSGHTLLCVLEFGSNPERRTTDQLVVFDVDHTAGHISIHNVQREVERLGAQSKCEV